MPQKESSGSLMVKSEYDLSGGPGGSG
jgi:hypothetical protein